MAQVVILFAHPRPDRSEMNAALAGAARDIEGVEFVDLYGEYPDFDIDIDREQSRLAEAGSVVFQHPVYWYSSPALLKEWQDLVLEHGFAYGSDGTALSGKPLLQIATCGSAREAYQPDGKYHDELRKIFSPFEQTTRFCGMRYLAPFGIFSAEGAAEDGRLETILSDYRRILHALREERLNLDQAEEALLLNDILDTVIVEESGDG